MLVDTYSSLRKYIDTEMKDITELKLHCWEHRKWRAILASTFTTIVVFLPIVLQRMAGEIFKELALTIAFHCWLH